jgi:hypothetical protein
MLYAIPALAEVTLRILTILATPGFVLGNPMLFMNGLTNLGVA